MSQPERRLTALLWAQVVVPEGPRGRSKAKAKGRGKGKAKAKGRGKGQGRGRGGSAGVAAEDLGQMHVPVAPKASAQDYPVLGSAASGMGQTEDIGVPSSAFAALHKQAALEDVRGACSREERTIGVVTRAAKLRAAEAEAAEVLCQLQTAQVCHHACILTALGGSAASVSMRQH